MERTAYTDILGIGTQHFVLFYFSCNPPNLLQHSAFNQEEKLKLCISQCKKNIEGEFRNEAMNFLKVYIT